MGKIRQLTRVELNKVRDTALIKNLSKIAHLSH